MFYNSLCQGIVWHKRFSPTNHEFSYKLNMWLLDINNLDNLNNSSRLLSSQKVSLYKFNPANYLRDYGNLALADKLKQKLLELGATLKGTETIFLLGQLSNLGVYFSPLNLYFVFNNDSCSYILAEVSNTPWNERYYYLLDKSKEKLISSKKFHVSPFFNLNQSYHWDFKLESDRLQFKIDTYEEEKKVFSAGYSCKLVPLQHKKFNLSVLKSPFNVYKIILGIYFEALRLWLKKVPFVPHPKSTQ